MTTVAVQIKRPAPSGVLVPVSGYTHWVPTRRRVIEGEPDTLVLPLPFTVELGVVPGLISVAPTGPGWAWAVTIVSAGIKYATEYYVVPDVPTIDFTDLSPVDPATLDPTAAPDPAWYALVEAIAAAQVAVVIVATPDDPRPTATIVLWFGGTVRPSNMLTDDIWFSQVA